MRRNPRRACYRHGREIDPMPLSNMREHCIKSVEATCEDWVCMRTPARKRTARAPKTKARNAPECLSNCSEGPCAEP